MPVFTYHSSWVLSLVFLKGSEAWAAQEVEEETCFKGV